MDKVSMRNNILRKRNELKIRKEKDLKIFDTLINSKIYNNSNIIFTYVSFGSEVDTLGFIEKAIGDGKVICVPVTNYKGREMKAVKINSLTDMVKSEQGILEPKCGEEIDRELIDFVIMPGVAFDLKGNRIGYGAGFYDRYLNNQKSKSIKVALGYEVQVVENAFPEEHDVRIDYIITENYMKCIEK